MKKFILMFTALIVFSVPAQAQDLCGSIRNISTAVMTARQSGASIDQVMQAAGDNEFMVGATKVAYKILRFDNVEDQRLAIKWFGDSAYQGCLNGVRDQALNK